MGVYFFFLLGANMSYNINTSNRFASFAAPKQPLVESKTSVGSKVARSETKDDNQKSNRKPQQKGRNDKLPANLNAEKRGGNRPRGGRGGRGGGRGGREGREGRGRKFDRQSASGKRNEGQKKGGEGSANWGGVQEAIELGEADVVNNPTEETNEEVTAQPTEPKVTSMTLEEYEKQQSDRLAKLELTSTARVIEADAELKEKFVVLEKKTNEEAQPKGKKSKKKSQGNKKQVLDIDFSFSDSGSKPQRGNGNRGRGGKKRGQKINFSEASFPSL